jgi:hypothetical protein
MSTKQKAQSARKSQSRRTTVQTPMAIMAKINIARRTKTRRAVFGPVVIAVVNIGGHGTPEVSGRTKVLTYLTEVEFEATVGARRV